MGATAIQPLPPETARAARGIFGKGNFYRMIGDQSETLFTGLEVPGWMEVMNHTCFHPSILLMITIFQMLEGLSDWRAVEAVRTRLDWKYALHLPLDFPGFDRNALCELRRRLLRDPLALQLFQVLLDRMKNSKLLGSKDLEPGDTYTALKDICTLTRLEDVIQAFNTALEVLASDKPDWLRKIARPHWYGRFTQATSAPELPNSSIGQQKLAVAIGKDVEFLLEAIVKAGNHEMEDLVEIQALCQVWREQFECVEGKVIWRKEVCTGLLSPTINRDQTKG